jgi:hypothetical protein
MQTGAGALYLAANEEYNAHRIVDMAPIAAEIRSIEYLWWNLQYGNYTVFDRSQR